MYPLVNVSHWLPNL